MLWKKDKDQTAKEFQEWQIQTKKELAVENLKEVGAMHERIKTRLAHLLSLSATLCSATAVGAYSEHTYAVPCRIMLFGFSATALTSILGLWSTSILTGNISPNTFDKILESADTPPKNKIEGIKEIVETFDLVSDYNLEKASKDRNLLKIAWIILLATPFIAWLVSICFRDGIKAISSHFIAKILFITLN